MLSSRYCLSRPRRRPNYAGADKIPALPPQGPADQKEGGSAQPERHAVDRGNTLFSLVDGIPEHGFTALGRNVCGVRPLKWMKENGGATALPREKAGAAKRRGSRPNREAGRTGPIGKWRMCLFVIGHEASNGLGFLFLVARSSPQRDVFWLKPLATRSAVPRGDATKGLSSSHSQP